MEEINRFTRSPLKAEEVYTFSIILCDNEIDRDFERFSMDALEVLAQLFIGKTGIMDHEPKTENQAARIYRTKVEKDSSRVTSVGEPYCMLKADAYMLRSSKNEEFIAEIEAGIKKEVSIGCSVRSCTCSICGKDLRRGECTHQKGQSYQVNGTTMICHGILDEPTDAYEWSFVAIPAQKNAGVYKRYLPFSENPREGNLHQTITKLKSAVNPVTFTVAEAISLGMHLSRLEKMAESGHEYRKELQREILECSVQSGSNLEPDLLEKILKKLEISELKELRTSLKCRIPKNQAGLSQLIPMEDRDKKDNRFFKL